MSRPMGACRAPSACSPTPLANNHSRRRAWVRREPIAPTYMVPAASADLIAGPSTSSWWLVTTTASTPASSWASTEATETAVVGAQPSADSIGPSASVTGPSPTIRTLKESAMRPVSLRRVASDDRSLILDAMSNRIDTCLLLGCAERKPSKGDRTSQAILDAATDAPGQARHHRDHDRRTGLAVRGSPDRRSTSTSSPGRRSCTSCPSRSSATSTRSRGPGPKAVRNRPKTPCGARPPSRWTTGGRTVRCCAPRCEPG